MSKSRRAKSTAVFSAVRGAKSRGNIRTFEAMVREVSIALEGDPETWKKRWQRLAYQGALPRFAEVREIAKVCRLRPSELLGATDVERAQQFAEMVDRALGDLANQMQQLRPDRKRTRAFLATILTDPVQRKHALWELERADWRGLGVQFENVRKELMERLRAHYLLHAPVTAQDWDQLEGEGYRLYLRQLAASAPPAPISKRLR